MQIQMFYNRLNVTTKHMLDAAAGGSLCSKQPEATQNLIDEMATKGYQWSSERNKAAGIYKVVLDYVGVTSGNNQQEVGFNANTFPSPSYELWSVEVTNRTEFPSTDLRIELSEKVDFVGQNNRYQNNPYNNNYNAWWRNHPNFSLS